MFANVGQAQLEERGDFLCFAQNPEIKLYLRRDYLAEVEQKSSVVPQNEHLVLKKARR